MESNINVGNTIVYDSPDELFLRTDDWLSELDYLADEMSFFKKILKSYLQGIDSEITERVEQVQGSLSELERRRRFLRSDIMDHRDELNELMIDKAATNEHDIREKHLELQSRFLELNKYAREFKDELFDITNEVYGE